MERSPLAPLAPLAPVVVELGVLSRVLVLRGLISILIAIFALVAPLPTLAVLVLLFGAYAVFDGGAALVGAARAVRRRSRAWPQIVHGSLGILVGIGAFAFPPVTELALVIVVAGWAIVVGTLELVAAVRLRKAIRGEWLLALSGVVSLVFGAALLVFPGAGLVAVATLIGIYSLVRGAVAAWAGIRIRGAIHRSSSAALPDPRIWRYP